MLFLDVQVCSSSAVRVLACITQRVCMLCTDFLLPTAARNTMEMNKRARKPPVRYTKLAALLSRNYEENIFPVRYSTMKKYCDNLHDILLNVELLYF